MMIPVRGTLTQDLSLAPSALQLQGIVVTGDVISRAQGESRGELGTATVIDREAIAQQPATSLAGILSLIPGMPLQAPGLEDVQQVSLRYATTTAAASAGLAAFGTSIVLDGVPLSNNSNLQQPPAGVYGVSGTAGGGVDLRRLPASTIERVEVIRGVPSARYGDLTQGAVVVETRAGVIDPDARPGPAPDLQAGASRWPGRGAAGRAGAAAGQPAGRLSPAGGPGAAAGGADPVHLLEPPVDAALLQPLAAAAGRSVYLVQE